MSEASLQKLKVTELKELLSKHDLPQTGKKDDLVKRLLEANIAPEAEGAQEELAPPEEESAPAEAPAAAEPTSTATEAEAAPTTELTAEQKAMKSRAERFGIAFNPNPTPTASKSKPAAAAPKASAAAPTPAAEKKEKVGAIDKAPLGISEEVLAKRAAKFGLPDKKEEKPAAPAAAAATAKAPNSAVKPKAEEMTPEMKEKLAIEEEKKRKRAEKFGTAKPANGEESEAKKAKV